MKKSAPADVARKPRRTTLWTELMRLCGDCGPSNGEYEDDEW